MTLLLALLLAQFNPYGPTGPCADLWTPMRPQAYYVDGRGCIVWTLGIAYTQRDQRDMLVAEAVDVEACGGELVTFVPDVVPVGWRAVQGLGARFCYPGEAR